jgi:hypothetical protein
MINNEIIKNKDITRNETFENSNNYRITLHIPKNNTSNFIESIRTVGIIINENKNMIDYTARYDDMEMRYQNLENQLEKYKKLLPDAGNLTETLTIEKEIERVEEEIKRIDMSNKEMEMMLNYAFIEINVTNKLSNR